MGFKEPVDKRTLVRCMAILMRSSKIPPCGSCSEKSSNNARLKHYDKIYKAFVCEKCSKKNTAIEVVQVRNYRKFKFDDVSSALEKYLSTYDDFGEFFEKWKKSVNDGDEEDCKSRLKKYLNSKDLLPIENARNQKKQVKKKREHERQKQEMKDLKQHLKVQKQQLTSQKHELESLRKKVESWEQEVSSGQTSKTFSHSDANRRKKMNEGQYFHEGKQETGKKRENGGTYERSNGSSYTAENDFKRF